MNAPHSTAGCPFRGLQPFTEADREFFFGRDRERSVIASSLRTQRLTVLFGSSGVGKTSLLMAGVIPDLKAKHQLKLSKYAKQRGSAVVLFRDWQPGFYPRLKSAVLKVTKEEMGSSNLDVNEALPLDDMLRECASRIEGPILLIFDQFEEYFYYAAHSPDSSQFDREFARIINRKDLQANVLICLREEGLSKLNHFDDILANLEESDHRVRNLFDNRICLDRLDRRSAVEAIRRPLDVYNHVYNVGSSPSVIADDVIEAILAKSVARSEEEDSDIPGHLPVKRAERFETPVLQLLLVKLWKKEMDLGSRELRLSTFRDELHGAENIVRNHVNDVMNLLSEKEQKAAASMFRYLVTSTGRKWAHDANALADYTGIHNTAINDILFKLSAQSSPTGEADEDLRLLRTVPGRPVRYEVFHDVLARAIRDWRVDYELTIQQQLDLEVRLREERQREDEERTKKELEQARAMAEERRLRLEAESQRAESERTQAEEQRKTAKRMKRLSLALLFLLICSIMAAACAFRNASKASSAEHRAKENEQTALANRDFAMSAARRADALARSEKDLRQKEQKARQREQEARKQAELAKEDATTAQRALAIEVREKERIASLLYEGHRLEQRGLALSKRKLDKEAVNALQDAVIHFSNINDWDSEARVYTEISKIYWDLGNVNAAISNDELAIEPLLLHLNELEQSFGNDAGEVVRVLVSLGDVYKRLNKKTTATSFYRRAFLAAVNDTLAQPQEIADLFDDLTSVQSRAISIDSTLETVLKAFDARTESDPNRVLTALRDVAGYLRDRHPEVKLDTMYYIMLAIVDRYPSSSPTHAVYAFKELVNLLEDRSRDSRREIDSMYRNVLRLLEVKAGTHPTETAKAYDDLAWMARYKGDTTKMDSLKSLAASLREHDLNATEDEIVELFDDRAERLVDKEKYGSLDSLAKSLIKRLRSLEGADPYQIIRSVRSIADQTVYAKAYVKADTLYKIATKLIPEVNVRNQLILPSILARQGRLYQRQALYREAESYFTEAVVYMDTIVDEKVEFGYALENLALLYTSVGKFQVADSLLNGAYSIMRDSGAVGDYRVIDVLNYLLHNALDSNDSTAAVRYLAVLDHNLDSAEWVSRSRSGMIAALRGRFHSMRGELARADSILMIAYASLKSYYYYDEQENYALITRWLAELRMRQGRLRDADSLLMSAKAIQESTYGTSHPELATTVIDLARLYVARGQRDFALTYYGMALNIRELVFGVEHPFTRSLRQEFNALYGP